MSKAGNSKDYLTCFTSIHIGYLFEKESCYKMQKRKQPLYIFPPVKKAATKAIFSLIFFFITLFIFNHKIIYMQSYYTGINIRLLWTEVSYSIYAISEQVAFKKRWNLYNTLLT